MTTNTVNPTNRIAKHLGNGKPTIEPVARESYVGKIVFVEPPIGTFGSGEYIVVDQTDNALYGVKLGSAYDGCEVRQIPLTGKIPWTVVRVEPDTTRLIEWTILLLMEFAATPVEDRHEDIDDCIYEGADYAAGALLRMLQRHDDERYRALVQKLERIGQEATANFTGKQATEASTEASADDSGSDDTKLTANIAADNNPTPVLVIDLSNFDMALAWLL